MNQKSSDSKDLTRRLAEQELLLTSYREIERELRLAKEFSENLIETANAIVLTLDLNANVTLMNLAAEKITGYSREEVLGKSWMELFIPQSERETIRGVFADVLKKGGEISQYENAILTKAGEERIINWSNNIIRGNDGAPVGVISIGVDVTERAQANSEIHESEVKYRKIFETANDVIFLFKGETIVDCNGRTVEMFGCESREDILALKVWEFSPKFQPDGRDSKEKAKHIIAQASAGRPQFFTWEHKRMNGELFDAEVALSSLSVGGEVYLLAVVRDVSQAKRAENMLRSAVRGTAPTTGRKFFMSLVQHLAEGLRVRATMMGELEMDPFPVINTLAFWDKGKHENNISYDLAGTPCEGVIRQGRPYCYSEVATQFPKGHIIISLGIHTYIGTPLVTSSGEVKGILAIMHDKPIPQDMVSDVESLLAVFAARAVAELERVRAEEKLHRESEALNQKNIAMSQILEHIEKDREKFREELALKLENLLLPTIKKLKRNKGHLSAKDIDHLDDALKSILNKEIDVFHRNLSRLSGRELQVCEMIRNGISSKEIAGQLGISLETVNKHRESIRSKLQIKHSKVNLGAYLKSKPWVV